jgi:hypothetical protein
MFLLLLLGGMESYLQLIGLVEILIEGMMIDTEMIGGTKIDKEMIDGTKIENREGEGLMNLGVRGESHPVIESLNRRDEGGVRLLHGRGRDLLQCPLEKGGTGDVMIVGEVRGLDLILLRM